MSIYDAIVRLMAESLALGNGVLSRWVTLPANCTGPLDGNVTLTASGVDLAAYAGSMAVHLSHIVCAVLGVLF